MDEILKRIVALTLLFLALIGVNIVFIGTLADSQGQPRTATAVDGAQLPNEGKKPTTLMEIKMDECHKKETLLLQDNCILSLIPLTSDIGLCNSIAGEPEKEQCITAFAVKTKDYALCDPIAGTAERYEEILPRSQLCKDEVAYLHNDIANCITNNCRMVMAKRLNDKDICNLIPTSAVQAECLRNI